MTSETDDNKVLKIPTTATQLAELRAEIAAVAATANPDDVKTVSEILSAAKEGKRRVVQYVLTPPVMATLHSRHNPHNRDTNAVWVRELARRMKSGHWRWNNELPGFYDSGELADAGHRFAAGAVAGFTWETGIVFGVQKDAIVTIDDGRKRHGSDAAKLHGVEQAALKETVLRQATAYLLKAGDQNVKPLLSLAEMADGIEKNSTTLDLAVEIARSTATNVVNPVLKETVACVIGYLMLTHHWPEMRVREKLALFNQGNYSQVGENDPFFVAGETITNARKKTDIKDRLTTNKEIGVVLSVMNMTATGVKAIRRGQLLAGIKKGLPDPTYPGEVAGDTPAVA
jgi:hypothetical protein